MLCVGLVVSVTTTSRPSLQATLFILETHVSAEPHVIERKIRLGQDCSHWETPIHMYNVGSSSNRGSYILQRSPQSGDCARKKTTKSQKKKTTERACCVTVSRKGNRVGFARLTHWPETPECYSRQARPALPRTAPPGERCHQLSLTRVCTRQPNLERAPSGTHHPRAEFPLGACRLLPPSFRCTEAQSTPTWQMQAFTVL